MTALARLHSREPGATHLPRSTEGRKNKDMSAAEPRTFAREREEMARHTIPQLIDLLESEDLRTRFLAEMVLRDATST